MRIGKILRTGIFARTIRYRFAPTVQIETEIVSATSTALSHRDFRRYLAAVFLGILAIQIQSVAVSWQIYAIAHSPMALGYVGLSQFVPMMACTLPAGHLADVYDRRLILAASYLAEAVARRCL